MFKVLTDNVNKVTHHLSLNKLIKTTRKVLNSDHFLPCLCYMNPHRQGQSKGHTQGLKHKTIHGIVSISKQRWLNFFCRNYLCFTNKRFIDAYISTKQTKKRPFYPILENKLLVYT